MKNLFCFEATSKRHVRHTKVEVSVLYQEGEYNIYINDELKFTDSRTSEAYAWITLQVVGFDHDYAARNWLVNNLKEIKKTSV